jgi:hypothetical protein
MAASELPTEAIATATAQPELTPELAAVAQPTDEVIYVEMAADSAALPAGPQAEAVAQALAASEAAVVADAQPATIVAQEVTAVATPATPIVEEATSLPAIAALDVQSVAAPVLEPEAVTASVIAVSAAEFDSLDQIMAQSEAVPMAEMVAVAVIPVASDLVATAPQAASAELFPDLTAAAPSVSRTSSSAGRLVLIALVVLVLLAAGVIAFLMFSGTNPLAHFGH